MTTTRKRTDDDCKENYCGERDRVEARLHWDASDIAAARPAIDGSVPRSTTTVDSYRHGEDCPDCCFDVCERMVVVVVVAAAGGKQGKVMYTIGLGCCARKETSRWLVSSK